MISTRERAGLFFLSDVNDDMIETKLEDLDNVEDSSTMASYVVNVWKPFEFVTVDKLLELIDKLTVEFDEAVSSALDLANKK